MNREWLSSDNRAAESTAIAACPQMRGKPPPNHGHLSPFSRAARPGCRGTVPRGHDKKVENRKMMGESREPPRAARCNHARHLTTLSLGRGSVASPCEGNPTCSQS